MAGTQDNFPPTLRTVLALSEGAELDWLSPIQDVPLDLETDYPKPQQAWQGAIAALNALLQSLAAPGKGDRRPQGLVVSGPLPVLNSSSFATWLFIRESLPTNSSLPLHLLPTSANRDPNGISTVTLPLCSGDPLGVEQFCMAFTDHFGLAIALGLDGKEKPSFSFSFNPKTLQLAWQVLRSRLVVTAPQHLERLDALVQQFNPRTPDYQVVTTFSRLLLKYLPLTPALSSRRSLDKRTIPVKPGPKGNTSPPTINQGTWDRLSSQVTNPDAELLRAISHEVWTPLATIRTLVRLLRKRQDLTPAIRQQLEAIDLECSEQIDRFGLIFRAAELETQNHPQPHRSLTPTPLGEVLHRSIPRWQQRAKRRNLTLDVTLPNTMPKVVSDPVMLDQALTSLIERYTRTLPASSRIKMQVLLAGDQLKLQLQSCSQSREANIKNLTSSLPLPTLKSLGQLLMFQPETGSLSLSLAVTKNLFQALGGKLTVRKRPHQGEVMTIFLPLEFSSLEEKAF